MVGTIVTQLTRGATPEDMRKAGLDPYYVDHGTAVFPQSAGGIPWTATYIQSKGDPITDLYENMAADAAPSQRQRRERKNRKIPQFFKASSTLHILEKWKIARLNDLF